VTSEEKQNIFCSIIQRHLFALKSLFVFDVKIGKSLLKSIKCKLLLIYFKGNASVKIQGTSKESISMQFVRN